MSQETNEWLTNNVLYGYVEHKERWASNTWMLDGRAWWDHQAMNANRFAGPVPVERVEQLLGFDVIAVPLDIIVPCSLDEADSVDPESGLPVRHVRASEYQAVYRPDTNEIFNVTSTGYRIHQYPQWLIDHVARLVSANRGELGIESAMLLQGGAVAAVTIGLPDDIETPAGFSVRPHLVAHTSHNSAYSTGYKNSAIAPVCDNSLNFAIHRAEGQHLKIRHTANSLTRISDAREALGYVFRMADDMKAAIEWLADWEVSIDEWQQLLNVLVPVPEREIKVDGKVSNQRAINNADNTRLQLTSLYHHDQRAATWQGTALGVYQAFNTHAHWNTAARLPGGNMERNALRDLRGGTASEDAKVITTLAEITDHDKVLVLN